MRILMIVYLMLMLLVLNCMAIEPIQLTGIGGKTILAQIASMNITDQVTKASPTDLWSWGDLPLNSELDKSGMLHELQLDNPADASDDDMWLYSVSQALGLNTSGVHT